LNFLDNFFEKYSNIKFNENPPSGSRFVPCGRTEMAKLIAVFLNYANAPKNDYFLIENYVVGLYKGPRPFSLSE